MAIPGHTAYYDPYWWWDSGSSYDEDYERDRATANEMNQQSLEQQRMLRQEEADGDQDIYSRNSRGSDPAPSESQQGTAILPPTVLVFRDQHKQEIGNYAIVGQTLWNFAPQRTQKIPLSDLDLARHHESQRRSRPDLPRSRLRRSPITLSSQTFVTPTYRTLSPFAASNRHSA